MVFGLFKKTDPICRMKQEKDKGFIDDKTGNWFCSNNCKDKFEKKAKVHDKEMGKHKGGCCH